MFDLKAAGKAWQMACNLACSSHKTIVWLFWEYNRRVIIGAFWSFTNVVTINVVIVCKRAAIKFRRLCLHWKNNNSMRFWNNFRTHNVIMTEYLFLVNNPLMFSWGVWRSLKQRNVAVDENQEKRNKWWNKRGSACNSMQLSRCFTVFFFIFFSLSFSIPASVSFSLSALFLCGPELTVIPKQSALIQRVWVFECSSAESVFFRRLTLVPVWRHAIGPAQPHQSPVLGALSQGPLHPLTP